MSQLENTNHCGGVNCPFEYSCVDGCMNPKVRQGTVAELAVTHLQTELSKAQERNSELMKQLRIFYNELRDRAVEYTDDSKKDIHINNSMFFRGKSEAYSHAAKKLNNIFQWLNIKL